MLIVDTFNILHAAADVDPRLAGLGPVGLARLVEASRFAGEGVLLVCDGTGGGLAGSVEGVEVAGVVEGPGVRWAFAGPGKDADSLIERILDGLERRGRGRGVKVVSNDKQVRNAAVGARAKRMDATTFLKTVMADCARKGGRHGDGATEAQGGGGVDAETARAWMREFGIGVDGSAVEPAAGDQRGAGDWAGGIDLDDLDTGDWVEGVERKPPG